MAEGKAAPASLAVALRDRIVERFKSQRQLAKMLGVTPQAISRLLYDTEHRQLKTLKLLLGPLDLHLEIRADDPSDPFSYRL